MKKKQRIVCSARYLFEITYFHMHLMPIHIELSVKQAAFPKVIMFLWIELTCFSASPFLLNRRHVHENHIRRISIPFFSKSIYDIPASLL
jgi:hypothetical protein